MNAEHALWAWCSVTTGLWTMILLDPRPTIQWGPAVMAVAAGCAAFQFVVTQ